ncbi:hypothetical protein UlMin_010460 [Ulmus minor]
MSEVQPPEPQQDEGDSKSANKSLKLKRKSRSMPFGGHVATSTRLEKRAILSLTKPSHTLALGSKEVRTENRSRLSYLLRRLVRQHSWTEASGVLSVLLKGTCKDKSMVNNRFKYSILMEVLEHVGDEHLTATKIRNIYDVWMRKVGSMKNRPVEERFVVHLEFILFCLTQGNVNDAHQAALSLMQEKEFSRDPVSNMVVGLVFRQLWYSTIPKEMLLTNSDQVYTPMQATEPCYYSEGHDIANTHEAGTAFQYNSDSSVMNNKILSHDSASSLYRDRSAKADSVQIETLPQNFPPRDFYANSAENTGDEAFVPDHSNQTQYNSIFSDLKRLDSLLLPIRWPQSLENPEDLIHLHTEILNDYYKDAVKYLQLALCSTPSVLVALLPLIQLLLVGGQVDEALNELDKLCRDSNATLPVQLRARLLEHFDRNNNVMLSACFEDVLKKDPTCRHSLEKLVIMHHNGDYCSESLLEMISTHLDATYADFNTWKELSSCFLKLSHYDEDQLSVCLNGDEGGVKHKYSATFNKIPKMFTEGKSGKSWRLRYRWWLTRHFSRGVLASEITAGDLQLLTYKAACASHIYGQQFDYVVEAYSRLEKENESELLSFLKLNIQRSMQLYTSFQLPL